MTPSNTIHSTTTDFAPVPAADLDRIDGGLRSEIGSISTTVLGPNGRSLPLPPEPFKDVFAKYHIG